MLIWWILLVAGLLLSIGMLLIVPWRCLSVLIFGQDFSSIGGFEVAGAGVYLPASELAFEGSVSGTAEEYGDARLERCRAFLPVLPGSRRLFSVLNSGVLLLLCRRAGLVI